MGVVRLSNAGIRDFQKVDNFLAGNDPVATDDEDFLEEVVLTSSASSVSFTGLDSYTDYKHLQIRATQRVTGSSLLYNQEFYLNDDQTSGRYASHELGGNGSSVFSSDYVSQDSLRLPSVVGADAAANIFNALYMDILDFSNPNKNTTIRTSGGSHYGSGGRIFMDSGVYLQTSAITSITFEQGSGQSYVAGSRFSLYGAK